MWQPSASSVPAKAAVNVSDLVRTAAEERAEQVVREHEATTPGRPECARARPRSPPSSSGAWHSTCRSGEALGEVLLADVAAALDP